MPTNELPKLGNRYQLLNTIGQGGMATVFAARDEALDRTVAIKVLRSPDPEGRDRFLYEARLVANLTHPNIVSIWDVGVHDDDLYIVMELLKGVPLSHVLREETSIPIDTTLRILIDVADALKYAHARDVIHRDIKPGNIFLGWDGKTKLLDFGVAKILGGLDPGHTRAGTLVGTPAFMSPEQIRGMQVDLRSDLFSVGAVAFQMLTGRKAFHGDDLVATMHQVLNEEPGPLPASVPAALDALVQRCLQKDPANRPASAGELLGTLNDIVNSRGTPDVQWPVARVAPPEPQAPPAPETRPAASLPIVEGGTMVGPVLKDDTVIRPAPTRPMAPSPQARPASPVPPVAPPLTRPAPPPPVTWPQAEPPPSTSGLEPGTRVDRFVVHELVARGQTGHLYKAFDPVHSGLIGLKVIDDRSTAAVGRLLRASKNWIKLRHEHLQTILEVHPGDADKPALIVTELIEGIDLGRVIAQQTMDLAQKIEIIIQVCQALDYMHSKNVVHREIKPRNIVITQSTMKATVLDSGLARSTETVEASFTRTGIAVGDLTYMAPEQANGRCDQRSDIYAVGAVLYELVMEEKPTALDPTPMLEKIEQADLPDKLRLALRQALQQDVNERYSTVRELADELRALVPEKLPPVKLSEVVVTLHGIRTQASWQRAFSEVATRSGLQCRLDRWNFGYFSVLKFISPWSRQAKVSWFRSTYDTEFPDHLMSPLSSDRPSIVAHSFGTYVLGNALLRYPFLRFNRVLLCGSILPTSFPWDAIIERGQVQAVRNEFGARDVWTNLSPWFIAGTGPSGLTGFTVSHKRLEQEEFDYSHSEYFDRGHMRDRWVPFLRRPANANVRPHERAVARPPSAKPWGLFALYALAGFGLVAGLWWWMP